MNGDQSIILQAAIHQAIATMEVRAQQVGLEQDKTFEEQLYEQADLLQTFVDKWERGDIKVIE